MEQKIIIIDKSNRFVYKQFQIVESTNILLVIEF